MRRILLFCLICRPVATLWGETPQKTNETDLARSYYSALNKTGNSGKADEAAALNAVKELKKCFPKDAITHIVAEH